MMNFFRKYKKIIYIIIFIIIIGLLGFLIWNTFFKQVVTQQPTKPEQEETGSGGLPQAGEGDSQIEDDTGEVGLPGEEQEVEESRPEERLIDREVSPVANGNYTK